MEDIDGGGTVVQFWKDISDVFDESELDEKAMKIFAEFLKSKKSELEKYDDSKNKEGFIVKQPHVVVDFIK